MGKTKISVVGEALPEKEKKKQERREAKKAARKAEDAIRKAAEVPSETVANEKNKETEAAAGSEDTQVSGEKKVSKYALKAAASDRSEKKKESPRYKDSRNEVDAKALYPLDTALNILKKFKDAKFDETVELHINTRDEKVSGSLSLPHGTGKTLRIKVADDALVAAVEKGNIDFDILVATPEMMPKLAKVARVLGPRGLMPNPKAGTVTQKPEEAVKKLEGGSVNYKTEAKAPIIHLSIGKKSFDEKKLSENVKAAISAIGAQKIKSATLTSTMNPGILLDVTKC